MQDMPVARQLVAEMMAKRNGPQRAGSRTVGCRVKKMRALKAQITTALGLTRWPGFGPAKVLVGLADYCSPSEAGIDFHIAGGNADAFHFAQLDALGLLRTPNE
ncbi:MAG: hypothetical protein ACREXT_10405 [Gammaproteobacteria bacterium]